MNTKIVFAKILSFLTIFAMVTTMMTGFAASVRAQEVDDIEPAQEVVETPTVDDTEESDTEEEETVEETPVTEIEPTAPEEEGEKKEEVSELSRTALTVIDEPQTATISATKILCPSEDLLPDWGNYGDDITSTTAAEFLNAEGNESCEEVDWNFEWSIGAAYVDDNTLTGGEGWTTFENGMTPVPAGQNIGLREQMLPGYTTFTGQNVDQNESAEFYCGSDVLNYDNLEYVNTVAGETYHCVAFNAHPDMCPNDDGIQTVERCSIPEPEEDMCNEGDQNGWDVDYYNYTQYDTGMNLPVQDWYKKSTYGNPLSADNTFSTNADAWTGWSYGNDKYKFSQVESDLMFGANNFFPFDSGTGLPYSNESLVFTGVGVNNVYTYVEGPSGTDYHFGLHATGYVDAPAAGNYAFTLTSDDDVWVYVDGVLVVDNSGVHGVPGTVTDGDIYLDEGVNKVELFYAERHGKQAALNFEFTDSTLEISAYEDCECENTEEVTEVYYSNGETYVGEGNQLSSVLSFVHSAWINISGASWIWNIDGVDTSTTVSETQTFRKEIIIDGTPTGATLEIAADNSYAVYVNGDELVGCANSSEFNYGIVATCEIPAEMLVTGENDISINVTNLYVENSTPTSNPAGLLYKLTVNSIECADDEDEEVCPWNDEISANDENCKEPEQLVCNPEVNLVQNGGFENPVLDSGTWGLFPEGDLLGWLIDWIYDSEGTPTLEIQNNVAGAPYQGEQHAELDGNHPVGMYQVIETIPGETYDFSYSYSARPGRDAEDNRIWARVDNNADATLYSADHAIDATYATDTIWTTYSTSFVADSETTIMFNDMGTDTSYGGYIDGVSLTCDPEPVVEMCTDSEANNEGMPLPCTYDPEPTVGNIVIDKYICPADTVILRSENGIGEGMEVPEGCVPQSGATFGIVHGEQTDANGPYPELSAPIDDLEVSNGGGIATFAELSPAGRYLVVETDAEGNKLAHDAILGLFCEGDGDQSDSNDNQELTFVTAGENSNCVAYNKMPVDDTDPMCYEGEVYNSELGECVPADNGGNDEPTPQKHSSSGSRVGGGQGGEGEVLGATTDVCEFSIDTYMRKGYKNDTAQVKVMQMLMNKYAGSTLSIDGLFGAMTEKAVKAFQSKYADEVLTGAWVGLKAPTGIFFRSTLAKAKNLECPEVVTPIPVGLDNTYNWNKAKNEIVPAQ